MHGAKPCYKNGRYGVFRRAYIRKAVKYAERPKMVAIGWYCDQCLVFVPQL